MHSVFVKNLLISGAMSVCCLTGNAFAANANRQTEMSAMVDAVMRPLMQTYAIPGMAVAITVNGENYFYNYGVTSLDTQQPVTSQTLFEIGSNSKTFTATLAAYAQVNGKLSLTDKVSQHLPWLKGSTLAQVRLFNLGTHTAAGLPLQVPETIQNDAQLRDYLRHWQAPYAAGTQRAYSNVSIGMLGMITARSMQMPFDDAMEKTLFPLLGMTHSYLHVPAHQMVSYAQGYTKQGTPVRLNPGVLSSPAYGIKSDAADMIRFIGANLGTIPVEGKLQQAIELTHTAYFDAGAMTQDLIWEQYPYPVSLSQLMAGNADTMIFQATKVSQFHPPQPAQVNTLLNKTGSTNGFASYVAFIPAQKMGIVMLANKNYPISPRVTAAYTVLTQLVDKMKTH